MEIRAFSPVVFTKDASGIIKQMESIGFEAKHVKSQNENIPVTSTIMKDGNDHTLTVVEGSGFPQTFTGIRIMVDDFEKAVAEFEAMGYVNYSAKQSFDTGTSRAALFRSPEGLMVSLAEHFR